MMQEFVSTVFLVVPVLTTTVIPGEGYQLVALKTGETVKVQPSAVRSAGLTASAMTLPVQGNATVYMQYTNAYFVGTILYNDGRTLSTDTMIDSSNDVNSFKWFLLDPQHNLTVNYTASTDSNRWMGTGSYTIIGDVNDSSCPSAKNNTWEQIAVNSTMFLFSDFYRANEGTRNYSKSCVWTLQAPALGTTLALNMLNYTMQQGEVLRISSTNGVKTYDSQMLEPLGMTYYNNSVVITYTRPVAVIAAAPAFRILIEPMVLQTKTCSLLYNGQKYKNPTGSFTNIRPYYMYNKYELCAWTVNVPANCSLDYCHINSNYGRLSGDKLTVQIAGKKYESYQPNACVHMDANDTEYEAQFVWESDGLYEYNGFLVNYTVTNIFDTETTTKAAVSDTICLFSQLIPLLILLSQNAL